MKITACLGLVLAARALVGCGGDTSSPAFSGSGGADASTGSGGAGTGGHDGVTGGTASTGGAGGATTGTGGTTSVPDGGGTCAPPLDPQRSTICLTLVPEDITAHPNDPQLDKKGILFVELFDKPSPAKGEKALDTVALPLVAGREISLDALPTIPLAAKLAGTAYIRATFVDNQDALTVKNGITYGVWVAGIDLDKGFVDNPPIEPVAVQTGAGTAVSIKLTALRKLSVTVHRTVSPVAGGDSQGPLAFYAVKNPDPSTKQAAFGVGTIACADVSTKDVVVEGLVVGAFPYYVAASLNDLGGPADFGPGTLSSVTFNGTKYNIPTQIDIAPRDYAPKTTVDLGYVVPLPADAGAVPPNSCADLRASSDGGVDGG